MMPRGDFLKLIIVLAVVSVMLIIVSVLLIVRPAHGTPVCLSKKEARQLWPKQHIYWYGSNHCWSNKRGGPPRNLRYDLIRENHAQAVEAPAVKVAQAGEQSVAAEKKTDPEPWPVAVKPIRIIEIIRSEPPLPATPVEEIALQPLPVPPPPHSPSLIAPIGGALAAILVALFILFRERIVAYVKRSAIGIYQRIGQAGKQVSSVGAFTRSLKPPVYHRNIREILRRVDRRGHADHLTKILDSIENTPSDEWKPADDSPLAHWSRSIRAAQDS